MLWLALAAAVAGLTTLVFLGAHSMTVHVGGYGPVARTPLHPTGLGGNPNPSLKFNAAPNSQYVPLLAL